MYFDDKPAHESTGGMSPAIYRKWNFLHHPEDLIKVSLLHTRGSAPRHEGFMVIEAKSVSPVSSKWENFPISGSIGGGLVEYQAILRSREWAEVTSPISKPSKWLRMVGTITLNPEFGQCCGGEVSLLYEYLGEYEKREYLRLIDHNPQGYLSIFKEPGVPPQWQVGEKTSSKSNYHLEKISPASPDLYIYGAGHVGRALVYHLDPLFFTVHWVDLDKSRFPDHGGNNIIEIIDPTMDLTAQKSHPHSLHLIMTFDHIIDYRIVKVLVKKKVSFLGLIGSQTKAQRFRQALKNDGFSPEEIRKLTCPIGSGEITGKDPHAIALDTVLQLVRIVGRG